MALPQRQEYDLEGAAEYLGCSTGDILYYLDKGLLRLSVSTEHSPDFVSVLFEKLSAAVQQLLQSLYNPDGIDLSRIKLDQASLDAGGAVSSLYLTHHQRNKIKDTVHELGEPIWLFQDFAGEQITIWHEDGLRGFWFYEEGGWIAGTFLDKEELDRLLQKKPAGSVSIASESIGLKPFQVPQGRVDEIAEAMVAYGNLFYKEKKRIPTSLDLQGFMLERGGKALQLTYDPRIEDFVFSFKPLSKRAFNDRYKEYRVTENTR